MTILLFANQAQTTIAAPISAINTQIQVASGTGSIFPQPSSGQAVTITLVDAVNSQITEIVSCTNITGDVLTVVRAQEGTVARAWAFGTFVTNLMTAGTANAFAQIYGIENGAYIGSFSDLLSPTATIDDITLTTGSISAAPVNGTDIANKTYVDAQIGTNYIAGAGLNLTGATFSIANTAVTAGTYGSASSVPVVVVNARGQIIGASSSAIQILPSQVTGLGTIATQNANAVAITGGTASGVAVTGGSVNATPIGTTTPAQGEFTNLIGQSVQFVSGQISTAPTNPTDIANKSYVDSQAAPVYTAGTGLNLSGNQFSIANTAVTAGSYGGATKTLTATANAQGQLTALAETNIAIPLSQVTDAGTIASQNANNVNITGGTISNISQSGATITNPTITGGTINNTTIGNTTPAPITASVYNNLIGGTF